MAQAFIGMGSSINRAENIKAGIAALKVEFSVVNISALYESEAVGFSGENFYNLVVELHTELSVEQLISRLKAIEIEHGRVENTLKYAPRTLDLDLLLYDRLVNKSLNVPRGEITENAFVLRPLSELAPALLHPVLKQTYQELWDRYPQEKQKLWKVVS